MTKTTERIDLEKLKAREQIMFFDEVLLFEDELHDHGVSMLSVKIVSFFYEIVFNLGASCQLLLLIKCVHLLIFMDLMTISSGRLLQEKKCPYK